MDAPIVLPAKLAPFHYQVGGHFVIMSLGDSLVCKPLGAREHLFYNAVPDSLKGFTPQYQGIATVDFIKNIEGKFDYVAKQIKTISPVDDAPSTKTALTHEEEKSETFRILKCSFDSDKRFTEIQALGGSSFSNPWTEKRLNFLSEVLSKLDITGHNYLVLENLTKNFTRPSIIDLKMGTRSYCDLMSPEKSRKHIERSASTTSDSLGVRFSGMLVYNSKTGCYNYFNKSVGHKITTKQEFTDIIKSFISNGMERRVDVVKEIIQKLKKLKDIVSQLDTFRFFSSSLLILYESDQTMIATSSEQQLVDIRIIDFENITHSGYKDPVKYEGPDEGFIFGLDSLITILGQC